MRRPRAASGAAGRAGPRRSAAAPAGGPRGPLRLVDPHVVADPPERHGQHGAGDDGHVLHGVGDVRRPRPCPRRRGRTRAGSSRSRRRCRRPCARADACRPGSRRKRRRLDATWAGRHARARPPLRFPLPSEGGRRRPRGGGLSRAASVGLNAAPARRLESWRDSDARRRPIRRGPRVPRCGRRRGRRSGSPRPPSSSGSASSGDGAQVATSSPASCASATYSAAVRSIRAGAGPAPKRGEVRQDGGRAEVHGGRDRLAQREAHPRQQPRRHVGVLAGDRQRRRVEARDEQRAARLAPRERAADERRGRPLARAQRVLQRRLHLDVDADLGRQPVEQVGEAQQPERVRLRRRQSRSRSGRPRGPGRDGRRARRRP